jgi:hypothetical protein
VLIDDCLLRGLYALCWGKGTDGDGRGGVLICFLCVFFLMVTYLAGLLLSIRRFVCVFSVSGALLCVALFSVALTSSFYFFLAFLLLCAGRKIVVLVGGGGQVCVFIWRRDGDGDGDVIT